MVLVWGLTGSDGLYIYISPGKGVVVFEVPHEFRLALSVVGDDQQLPWRLVNLEVLVGAGLRGSPPLCHTHQTRYLTQLAQSHLVTADPPLSNTFTLLHTFCLSLLLDCLHTQVGVTLDNVSGAPVLSSSGLQFSPVLD